MYCLKCGKQIDNDTKFCTNCGTPVKTINTPINPPQVQEENKENNVCPSCGEIINESNLFCPSCGTKIEKAPQQPKPKYKYCQGCGTQLEISTRFCPNCGTDTGAVGVNGSTMQQNSFFQKIKPGRTLSKYKDINDLKRSVNSWVFMILLISFSLYALSLFIETISGSNAFGGIYRIFNIFGISTRYLPDFLDDILDAGSAVSVLIGLIKMTPVGLTLCGMILFYLSCLDEKNDSVNTKGLRIIYVLYKILFISGIALAGIVETIIAIMLIDGNRWLNRILIPALLIAPLFFVFEIFYNRSIMKTVRMIEDTVKNNSYAPNCKISVFLIICVMVSGLGQIFNIFTRSNIIYTFGSFMFLSALGLLVYMFIKFNADRSSERKAFVQPAPTMYANQYNSNEE